MLRSFVNSPSLIDKEMCCPYCNVQNLMCIFTYTILKVEIQLISSCLTTNLTLSWARAHFSTTRDLNRWGAFQHHQQMAVFVEWLNHKRAAL